MRQRRGDDQLASLTRSNRLPPELVLAGVLHLVLGSCFLNTVNLRSEPSAGSVAATSARLRHAQRLARAVDGCAPLRSLPAHPTPPARPARPASAPGARAARPRTRRHHRARAPGRPAAPPRRARPARVSRPRSSGRRLRDGSGVHSRSGSALSSARRARATIRTASASECSRPGSRADARSNTSCDQAQPDAARSASSRKNPICWPACGPARTSAPAAAFATSSCDPGPVVHPVPARRASAPLQPAQLAQQLRAIEQRPPRQRSRAAAARGTARSECAPPGGT